MAEAPEIINVPDDDDGHTPCPGPRNLVSAEEYAEGLNNIILQFKEAVLEDRKDTLLSVVNLLKRKMTAQFEQMRLVDVDVVMRMIKDPRCLTLHQSMKMGQVVEMDPNKDIPTE